METEPNAFDAFLQANKSLELTPTNLPGVFSSKVLPKQKAGDTTSASNPDPKNWVDPLFTIRKKSPRPSPLRRIGATSTESDNWAGSVIETGFWNYATGTWTVPEIQLPDNPKNKDVISSSWVGIDGNGDNSTDVLQAGVVQFFEGQATEPTYTPFYEWYCPYEQQKLTHQSATGLALAQYRKYVYVAWQNTENQLCIARSKDNGQTFSEPYKTPGGFIGAPTLAAYESPNTSCMFIGWTDKNEKINFAQVITDFKNGEVTGLTGNTTLNESSKSAPSLAIIRENLFIAWTGTNKYLNVLCCLYAQSYFGKKYTSSETSKFAPTLATTANGYGLFIGWTGTDGRLNVANVNFNTSPNIAGIQYKKTLASDYTTDAGPALCGLGSRLVLTWIDDGKHKATKDTLVLVIIKFDNKELTPFASPTFTSEKTKAIPALAGNGTPPFIGWTDLPPTAPQLNISVVGTYGDAVTGITSPPYVAEAHFTDLSVKPGDVVSVEVAYLSAPDYLMGRVYFYNQRSGKWSQLVLAPPPGASLNGASAEWIMEASDGGYDFSDPSGGAILPKFTNVTFTRAQAISYNGPVEVQKKQAGEGTLTNIVVNAIPYTETSIGSNNETVIVKYLRS